MPPLLFPFHSRFSQRVASRGMDGVLLYLFSGCFCETLCLHTSRIAKLSPPAKTALLGDSRFYLHIKHLVLLSVGRAPMTFPPRNSVSCSPHHRFGGSRVSGLSPLFFTLRLIIAFFQLISFLSAGSFAYPSGFGRATHPFPFLLPSDEACLAHRLSITFMTGFSLSKGPPTSLRSPCTFFPTLPLCGVAFLPQVRIHEVTSAQGTRASFRMRYPMT